MKHLFNLIKTLKGLFFVFLLFLSTLMIDKVISYKGEMGANFYGPYLSGAKNLTFGGDFMISTEECSVYENLNYEDRLNFEFTKTSDLNQYFMNEMGFCYFVWAATNIFYWLPDLKAIFYFQMLVHAILSGVFLLGIRKNKWLFFLFLFLYVLNPVIISFTHYFYYFWMVIPSFALLYLHKVPKLKWFSLFLFTFIIPFVLATRLTTILVVFILWFYLAREITSKLTVAVATSLMLFFAFLIVKPNVKPFFHTAYIGLAAYPHPDVKNMLDNTGFEFYQSKKNIQLSGSIKSDFYDPAILMDYNQNLKIEFLRIVKDKPLLFIRNVTLNTLQLFFVGHYVGGGFKIALIFSFIGLILLLFLMIRRKFELILFILAPSILFIAIYPPIAVYMYGSYLFLILVFYEVVIWLKNKYFVQTINS